MTEQLLKLDDINKQVLNNSADFIKEAESRYSQIISSLADKINNAKEQRFIMLAGPSASGKTTSAKFLAAKLEKLGAHAHSISLDNFYKDQRDSPENEDGTPDYETVNALDLPLLDKCLNSLLKNGESELPIFDFVKGVRSSEQEFIKLEPRDIIIVEGINALNPKITDTLPKDSLLKLYVSVSSRIYDDDSNVLLGKREMRLIRRIVRDYQYRSSSVENTCWLWKSVLKGEDKYLFPYSDNADLKIDSIHSYEPCVFRTMAVPLLEEVAECSEYACIAKRLKECLAHFEPLSRDRVPDSSLLKEFVG